MGVRESLKYSFIDDYNRIDQSFLRFASDRYFSMERDSLVGSEGDTPATEKTS